MGKGTAAMAQSELSRRGALTLALSGALAAMARDAQARGRWDALRAAMDRLVGDRAAPGVSVSVMRAGRFEFAHGAGLANLETGTSVQPGSVFRVGSVTKQFTAAAILSLAEEGKLSVDDSLARYFADFPRAGEITVRQMLTHTAGLGNYTSIPREAFNRLARLDYDPAALYQLMLGTKPLYVCEPGTAHAYSNTAYVLLGLIVQKVAGEAYGAYFKRRLFDRAGLTSTAVDDAADIVPQRVAGYTPTADGKAFENAAYISMTVPGGAGSIRSTSEDLCRWHDALFNGRIIAPESLSQMLTPQRLKSGDLPPLRTLAGLGRPVEYGFGLGMDTLAGRRVVGHNGSINGFSSLLQTVSAEKLSFSILVNSDSGPSLAGDVKAIRDTILDRAGGRA